MSVPTRAESNSPSSSTSQETKKAQEASAVSQLQEHLYGWLVHGPRLPLIDSLPMHMLSNLFTHVQNHNPPRSLSHTVDQQSQ